MGKNLILQKRGKGSPTYRAHSFRFRADVKYRPYDEQERTSMVSGTIVELTDCPGHSAPLARVVFGKDSYYLFAPHPCHVGMTVSSGVQAPVRTGNTLPLKQIPEGTSVYNLESQPGDGGVFCRAAGTFSRVVTVQADKILVQLPSKKMREFHPDCRATIGVIAGSGRLDKPFVKAGTRHHLRRSQGRLYPLTSGVAMNAVDHPFGSGRGRHPGKPKTAPRFAPAGRKVGKIHARKTGRGK